MMHSWQVQKPRYKTLFLLITALGLMTLVACSSNETNQQVEAEDAPAASLSQSEQPKVEGETIATGSFVGQSDHETSGSVSIVESDGKYWVKLAEDFSLDGAPDPKVGLGNDGYDPATKSGQLASLKGASSYEIPARVDVANYNEVYIWCEKFDVPLGVAKLKT